MRSTVAFAGKPPLLIMIVVYSKKSDGGNDFSECRMMSGTSNGRNELIYEAREMSVTGNAVQKCASVNKYTQIELNMDLGSGDTPNYPLVSICGDGNENELDRKVSFVGYFQDVGNHRESYVEEQNYSYANSEPVPLQARTYETQTSVPSYERLTSVRFDSGRATQEGDFIKEKFTDYFHKSSENINFMDGNRNTTLAIVEDNHQPSFTARESNPSIPSPNEHSKTSTLRISDRSRSGKSLIYKVEDRCRFRYLRMVRQRRCRPRSNVG